MNILVPQYGLMMVLELILYEEFLPLVIQLLLMILIVGLDLVVLMDILMQEIVTQPIFKVQIYKHIRPV